MGLSGISFSLRLKRPDEDFHLFRASGLPACHPNEGLRSLLDMGTKWRGSESHRRRQAYETCLNPHSPR